jgi:hypothetical protein
MALGLGLGLSKKRQAAWQTAATAGTGADWLAQHKRLARRVGNLDPASTQAQRVASFNATGTTPWMNPSTPTLSAPVVGAPDPGTPQAQGTPTGGPGAGTPAPSSPMSMSDMAKLFAIKSPQEYEAVSNFAQGNLPKVAQFDNSAYEEQFNRLMQQSAREGDVNAAKLRETYGSMGARYGSDIATAEADMRRKQTLDLQAAGFGVRQNLNAQRLTELQGTVGALENIGTSKANILTQGMQDMWKGYGIDMAPPAMWDEMAKFATSFGPPDKVVY